MLFVTFIKIKKNVCVCVCLCLGHATESGSTFLCRTAVIVVFVIVVDFIPRQSLSMASTPTSALGLCWFYVLVTKTMFAYFDESCCWDDLRSATSLPQK